MSRSSGAGRVGVAHLADRARQRAGSTAGIYRLGDRDRWHAVGAGVCVRIAGRSFVISTGRVLVPPGQPLWLGGRSAVVPLVGAAVLADGPDAPPEVATLDAAFGLLAGEDAAVLAGDVAFLSLADVDLSDGTGNDVFYAVAAPALGDRATPGAPAPAMHVRLRPAPSGDYRRHGVDFATHLVLRPDAGAPTPPPDDGGWQWAPDRMRGCGVWRASGAKTGDPLAGIVIDAVGGAQPRIVATRPCFTVLGIMGCLGAGLPGPASVRRPN